MSRKSTEELREVYAERYRICAMCIGEAISSGEPELYMIRMVDSINKAIEHGDRWINVYLSSRFGRYEKYRLCIDCPYAAEQMIIAGRPIKGVTRESLTPKVKR